MLLPVRAAYGSVVLRRFRLTDAERVAALCGDPAVAQMTAAIPQPYTTAMAADWICDEEDDSDRQRYAVLRREDDTLVGGVGLHFDETASEVLGYWIGRPYWGRGYATDAATAALAFAFTLLRVDAVHAAHLERNRASGRVLEKCGMRELRREMRPHRGATSEPFRLWSIERDAWVAWMER